MKPMTRIKICGLTRQQDIDAVNEAMPDYIGFVFAKSRRQIGARQAGLLKERLAPGIQAAGVFVDAPIEEIAELCRQGIIDVIQLHGSENADYIRRLRKETDKPIIKAVSMGHGVTGQQLMENPADYLLLDQGKGGTGKTFDWNLIPQLKRPFFLAGGLGPDNLGDALRQIRPFAVDLSSGVETDGKKDREKILQAVRRVKDE